MKKRSMRAQILVALGLGLLLAIPPARAQVSSFSVRDRGYDQGYRDGYEYGRDVRARNVALDFRTDSFRDADHGYQSYFGPVELFRDGYRDGYRSGAEDGFGGVQSRVEQIYRPRDDDNYVTIYRERRWDFRDVANDVGYRDGVNTGLRDFRERHSFRPEQHDAWRDADHGYTGSFGPKDEYKRAYRAAYEAGYRDGYAMR